MSWVEIIEILISDVEDVYSGNIRGVFYGTEIISILEPKADVSVKLKELCPLSLFKKSINQLKMKT